MSHYLRVLTVRQPWAGAIVHLGKDVENRPQRWAYRGPVLIHAGLYRPTIAEYDQVAEIIGWPSGHLANERWGTGSIIGIAEIVACVDRVLETADGPVYLEETTGHQVCGVRATPWFTGPYGYVLRNTHPLTTTPYRGGLGLRRAGVEVIVEPCGAGVLSWGMEHGYDFTTDRGEGFLSSVEWERSAA